MSEPTVGSVIIGLIAKLRVAIGFTCGAFVLWLSDPTLRSMVIGTPVAIAGEIVRLWASGHLNKSREVTASGPYRFVSHPLYLGSSMMGVGLAMASGSVFVAFMIVLYLVIAITAAIKSEEAQLRTLFGQQYDLYRANGQGNRSRRFSFERAMQNREYRAVVGLVIAVLLLAWKATYNGSFGGTAGP